MFTDSSELLFLIPLVATLLILMARFDIYLSNRRNQMANARYLAEMESFRKDYTARDQRMPANGLIIGVAVMSREPGRLSRRRVITDVFGRTVATHYEELRFADNVRAPLRLVA